MIEFSCVKCGELVKRASNAQKYCKRCAVLARKEKRKERIDYDRAYNYTHYHNNKEIICASARKYYWEHKEERHAYSHQRYIKNKEKSLAISHQYYIDHTEQLRGYSRNYRKENLDKCRVLNQNRRARIKGNGGTHTVDELNSLFEQQAGFCFYCGKLLYSSFDKEVHTEHKIPVSRGGSSDISNIVLSCSRCNYEKGTKTHEEFLCR